MKKVFVVLLVVCPALSSAQYVFSSKAAIQSVVPEVTDWLPSALQKAIPFGYIQLIDLRSDTATIGLQRAGFLSFYDDNGNRLFSLQKWLNEFYKPQLANNTDTLVIALQQLMVACNMHFQRGSWQYQEDLTDGMRIAMDFYRKNEAGYEKLYAFHFFNNPVLANRKSWAADRGYVKRDVSSQWSDYVVNLFDTAFNALNTASTTQLNATATAADFTSVQKHFSEYPINRVTSFKKGIYRNFAEFLANEPGIETTATKVAPGDTTCWGFSTGEKVFIRKGEAFYEISKYHNTWYLSSCINTLSRKTTRADLDPYLSLTLFRLLTHPAEGSHGDKDVSPILMMRIQNKNIMALRVNYETGLPDF